MSREESVHVSIHGALTMWTSGVVGTVARKDGLLYAIEAQVPLASSRHEIPSFALHSGGHDRRMQNNVGIRRPHFWKRSDRIPLRIKTITLYDIYNLGCLVFYESDANSKRVAFKTEAAVLRLNKIGPLPSSR